MEIEISTDPERLDVELIYRWLAEDSYWAVGIPRDSLPRIVESSLKNFNADPKREFIREREMLQDLIQACW